MATFNQKLAISASSAAQFALLSLPFTYKLTDKLLNTWSNGCPTALGLIVHAVVFYAISYLTMGGSKASDGLKHKYSFWGTLIFFLVSNPVTYKFVASILGPKIASSSGCPTLLGVALHALVYCAILVGVMYFPPDPN